MGRETYTTALSPEECLERLRGRSYTFADLARFRFSPPKEGTVFAKVRGSRFRLFAQGPGYLQNSFMPFFYGRLEQAAAGTRIHGHFGVHPFIRVFLAVWFGMLTAGTVVVLVITLAGKLNPGGPHLLPIAMMVGFYLFMFGLIRFGRYLGRGQRASLDAFIRDVLEARPQWRSGPTR